MIDVGTNNERLLKDPLCKCFYILSIKDILDHNCKNAIVESKIANGTFSSVWDDIFVWFTVLAKLFDFFFDLN